MTATDELRRMLDERGVEWGNIRNDGSESDYLTEWQFEDNQGKAIAIEWAVGSGLSVEIHLYHLTPEQTIAATLVAGTCRDLADTPKYGDKTRFECSECGYEYSAVGGFGCDYGDEPDFRFCPNCGRKVVDG